MKGRKQEWAEGAVGQQGSHEGSADLVGSSEAGMALQNYSRLGQGARAYSPSLAIHWMQMPWKEGVALGEANLCS